VTGASSGIGLHTALGLARAGFHVIMAGRDREPTEAASRFVAKSVPGAGTEAISADFASLAAVRELAAQTLDRHDRLDVLVNNAGMITPRQTRSVDGFELTIAVNHLAPFLLTNLLLDRLRRSSPARIVIVSSGEHKRAALDPATMTHPANWTPLSAYARSKLANVSFTFALARRLDAAVVTACCLHPRVAGTGLGNSAGGLRGVAWRLTRPFLPRPRRAAETAIYLSTVADPTRFHGAYVVDKAILLASPAARDEAFGEALWAESARLVGLSR
jgi:NAD(P)-dependent dehydrogenase (short-subunit alcohol dehydrogenase family)